MSEPKWHRVSFTADLFFVERPEIGREEASKLIYRQLEEYIKNWEIISVEQTED
jgi:hypothetical protein